MQKCADVHVYKFLKLRNNCLISLQEEEKINKDEYKMLYFMFKTGSTILFIIKKSTYCFFLPATI